MSTSRKSQSYHPISCHIPFIWHNITSRPCHTPHPVTEHNSVYIWPPSDSYQTYITMHHAYSTSHQFHITSHPYHTISCPHHPHDTHIMVYHTHIKSYHLDIISHSHHIITFPYHIISHPDHDTSHLYDTHIRSQHRIAQPISESSNFFSCGASGFLENKGKWGSQKLFFFWRFRALVPCASERYQWRHGAWWKQASLHSAKKKRVFSETVKSITPNFVEGIHPITRPFFSFWGTFELDWHNMCPNWREKCKTVLLLQIAPTYLKSLMTFHRSSQKSCSEVLKFWEFKFLWNFYHCFSMVKHGF